MKTSTKIILAYTILLLTGALTIFIAEIYVGKQGQEKRLYNVFTKQLPPFSVVVAEENARFRIEMSDTNSIDWKLPKDMSIKGEPAYVRNDTLFVTKTLTGDAQDFVVRSKALTIIVTSKGSCIRLIDPILDKLTVLGKGGEVFLDNEQQKNTIRIGQLDIVGKKMDRIQISIPMNCLNAQLDSVELTTYAQVNEANLDLVKNSYVQFNNYKLSRLKLKKDSSCWVKINYNHEI